MRLFKRIWNWCWHDEPRVLVQRTAPYRTPGAPPAALEASLVPGTREWGVAFQKELGVVPGDEPFVSFEDAVRSAQDAAHSAAYARAHMLDAQAIAGHKAETHTAEGPSEPALEATPYNDTYRVHDARRRG